MQGLRGWLVFPSVPEVSACLGIFQPNLIRKLSSSSVPSGAGNKPSTSAFRCCGGYFTPGINASGRLSRSWETTRAGASPVPRRWSGVDFTGQWARAMLVSWGCPKCDGFNTCHRYPPPALETRRLRSRGPRAALPPEAPGEGPSCLFQRLGVPGGSGLVAAFLPSLPPSSHGFSSVSVSPPVSTKRTLSLEGPLIQEDLLSNPSRGFSSVSSLL